MSLSCDIIQKKKKKEKRNAGLFRTHDGNEDDSNLR